MLGVIKAVISGILIAAASETAKRSPAFGALIASLPLVSILTMIWLWHDTKDTERLAAHSESTFWFVLPSLPMFLILPAFLRAGMSFYLAMGLCCVITATLYFAMIMILKKLGISL
ncbi:MAG: DUF3147 family protein [Alcanivorax sp.]